MSNLIWEDLQLGGLKILQAKNGYRFTSDAVVLANFVKCKSSDTVVEFCAGSAVISTLVCYKQNPQHIYAFEVQKQVANRAQQSVNFNKMQNKITVLNKPNSGWNTVLAQESANIVVCNPPYQKLGHGVSAKNKEIEISKAEVETTLEQIIFEAKKVLKYGGALYICMQPQRIVELLDLLSKHGFGVENLFFSYSSQTAQASCAFVKALKAKKQQTTVLPPLFTHNNSGDYVTTIKNLFLG